MLLEQLREQDRCIKAFKERLLHIESTIVEHQNNVEHPILTTSIYDALRNTVSRSRRLAEVIFDLDFLLAAFAEDFVSNNNNKIFVFFLEWPDRKAGNSRYDIGSRYSSSLSCAFYYQTECHWIGQSLWKLLKWHSNGLYGTVDDPPTTTRRRKTFRQFFYSFLLIISIFPPIWNLTELPHLINFTK